MRSRCRLTSALPDGKQIDHRSVSASRPLYGDRPLCLGRDAERRPPATATPGSSSNSLAFGTYPRRAPGALALQPRGPGWRTDGGARVDLPDATSPPWAWELTRWPSPPSKIRCGSSPPRVARKKITVNAVCPTFVPAGMNMPEPTTSMIKREAALIPMGRICGTEDIIGAVRYLLSSAASFISGQSIVLSGAQL
jgi:hypothetical protein